MAKVVRTKEGSVVIEIKPISVNDAWKGKRYKTDLYKAYESELLYSLKMFEMPKPPYFIHYTFGFSNKKSDIDNPVKQTQDILTKKYKFSDADIYRILIDKVIVEKGKEFVQFKIETLCTPK